MIPSFILQNVTFYTQSHALLLKAALSVELRGMKLIGTSFMKGMKADLHCPVQVAGRRNATILYITYLRVSDFFGAC